MIRKYYLTAVLSIGLTVMSVQVYAADASREPAESGCSKARMVEWGRKFRSALQSGEFDEAREYLGMTVNCRIKLGPNPT
jgi:hypothetical protein